MYSGLHSLHLSMGDTKKTFLANPVPRLHEAEPDIFARFEGVPGYEIEALSKARVLLIGAGGLNTWTGIGLARSGATRLTVVDPDIVEITNLQRQPYASEDRGSFKALAFGKQLLEQGHMVAGGEVRAFAQPFDEAFLEEHDERYDLVIVGVDNNIARLLAAGWARERRIPAVFTAMSLDGGFRCYAFLQGSETQDACLHCARPDLEPEDVAPCASVTIAGCFAASSLAVFFSYRALMGWPSGTEPFNYREVDLLGEAPDTKAWVAKRKDCPTCGV